MPTPPPGKRLLSLKECVAHYGVNPWWWRQRIWNGELPYINVGRKQILDSKDIEAFLLSKKVTQGE